MKNLIAIVIFLTMITLCKGQGQNLVPIDSANFEIISDTLFEKYSFLPDSIKFNPKLLENCPCIIDSLYGLVSYRSASFLIKRNKCLFIYKTPSNYYIRVGQMTNKKDEVEKYIWLFSSKKLKDGIAKDYVSKIQKEIEKAEIPHYPALYIVADGTSHTFGNIEKSEFATTPITNYSDSLVELIRYSERLIKRNK